MQPPCSVSTLRSLIVDARSTTVLDHREVLRRHTIKSDLAQ